MNHRTLALTSGVLMLAAAAMRTHAATPEMGAPTGNPGNPSTPDSVVPEVGTPLGAPKSATDTVRAAQAGARESKLGESDRQFVIQASQIGMAEVAAANVALDKAASPKVKDYAKMMAGDHMKNNAELKGLAERGYVKVGQLDDKNTDKIETLEKASGADFDRAYMADMVQGHRAAIDLFQGATKDVQDAELKAYVNRTLPTLQKHLTAAQQIAKDVDGGSTPGGH